MPTRLVFLLLVLLAVTTSAPTTLAEQSHGIPGLIETEHYAKGPAGEAYYDVDEENQGVAYRDDTQVDIEQRPDASNGHGIGWTRAGEWLNYRVNVAKSGKYDLEIPVASNKQGGIFHIEFDGQDVSGPIHVPDTGGWTKMKTIYATGLQLKAGDRTMKLVMDSQGPSGSIGDIDYIHFVNSTAGDNTLSAIEQKAGWKLIFNGQDHSGWKCNNGKAIATQVEDGALVPYKSGGYLILHEDRYEDFVIKCDVKWEAARCNSGIFFRVDDPSEPVHSGFEVQVMNRNGGGKHSMGAIYDLVPPSHNPASETGAWTEVAIRCEGPNISVRVNGQPVSSINCDEFDQPGLCPDGERHKFKLDGKPRAVKDFSRSGFLGFQDHGQKVWYKNVKVLRL